MKILFSKIILICLVLIVNQSCISRFVIYRIGPITDFYNDSLLKIENAYIDNEKNLTVNFKAKLKNNEVNNYHLKVNLLNENYDFKMDSLRKPAQFNCEFIDKYTSENDSSKSNIYKGYCFKEIKRRELIHGFDTIQTISNNLNDSCFSKLFYEMRWAHHYGKYVFYSDFYNKICINYFPDTSFLNNFYVFQLKQRKKYDKRYIKILTIPIDVMTSPLQIIYFFGKRFYSNFCNINRKS